MGHQPAVILEEGGIAVAVHDPLVQDELYVDVLFLDHFPLIRDLVGLALHAEGTEHRQVAKVIQMVVNGTDAETSHGGEEQASVEGAQLQQEPGQQTKVIKSLQQPHGEFQKHTGDQIQQHDQAVQIGVQLLGGLDLFHRGIQLLVNILHGIMGIQMDLDGGIGGGDLHFLLDDHAVLDILAPGVDLLTGNKPVQLGIFGHTADIGCQQNMGDAKIAEAFPALLADVAVHLADLEGFFKEIGADVPLPLEVGCDLGHGVQRADPAAVDAVTPGGMVLSVGMDTDGKDQDQHTQKQQNIRQTDPQGHQVTGQQRVPVEIQDEHQRCRYHGNEENDGVLPSACRDVRIKRGKEDQGDPEQPDHHPALHILGKPDAGINGHHPNGDSGFVEQLVAAHKGDQRIQCGCCKRQDDLAPHIQRIPGPFQTGEGNAGHCRSHQAQRHQPGQHVFTADI